ncbi:MAG: hypothetical protein ACHQIG_09820 [Acidimicrobiia bacterium]
MPDDRSRHGAGRRIQYDLPPAYGSPRRAPVGAVDDDLDHDYALDDEGSVRAVHRDDELDVGPGQDDPAPAPRSRREYVEQRDDAAAPWRSARTRRSPRRTWLWRGVGIAVVVLLIPVAYSYVNFLRQPGTDTLAVRSVEWLRDHGANGVVNTVERWWYTNNPPPTGGRPDRIEVQGTAGDIRAKGTATDKTPTVTTVPVQYQHLPPPTNRVSTPAPVVEANEGVWMPVGRQVAGMPAEYITFVRPDAAHTSYYAALMWLDTKLLNARYVPGLQEPGGNGPNPWGSMVPPEARGTLIAAFNSGFKMDSARGGVYFGGQEIRPLVNGAASIVVFKDGSASVGVWGRDFTMSPDVDSVRQNLELLIDNGGGPLGVAPGGTTPTGAPGTLNPALREDDTTVFGATLGNNVYVWRSGVGVTASGALVYAGGPAMSVLSLARTLQNAGAVRAMELDINTDWVSAFTYVNENATDPASPVIGIKLGGDMSRSGDRYLVPGERDFFAFFADPQVALPTPATTTTTLPASTTTTKR